MYIHIYSFLGCTDTGGLFTIENGTFNCANLTLLAQYACFVEPVAIEHCCESCHKAGIQIPDVERKCLYGSSISVWIAT